MSNYTLTERARRDLIRIWRRIAEDNLDAADRVVSELRQAMEKLATSPGMGHWRADVRNSRYRFWCVYSYLIAYFPDTNPLQIVRVVHGARDIGRLFRK